MGGLPEGEAGALIEAVDDVEGLDGLAACAFPEVVLCGHEDEAVGAGVDLEADVDEICMGYVFGIGWISRTEEADEGCVGVGALEGGLDVMRGDVFLKFYGGGGGDAGVDGDEVGEEGDGDFLAGGEGEFLFDF